MDQLYDFSWNVTVSGYRVMQCQYLTTDLQLSKTEEAFVSDGLTLGSQFEYRRYYPLQDKTGLFRSFAETEATEAGILAFANRYGELGAELHRVVVGSRGKQLTLGMGEPFSAWIKHIRTMALAVRIYDAIKDPEPDDLSRLIIWKGSNSVHFESDQRMEVIAAEGINEDLLRYFPAGDLRGPAEHYLQQLVNKEIDGRVSPKLLWNREHSHLSLYMRPSSLLGAMWLQFARMVDGDKTYRTCDECGDRFELSPKANRADRRYCSNACRSLAYRKRQARARELAGQRVPVKKIAAELETDVETVKGWIKRGR